MKIGVLKQHFPNTVAFSSHVFKRNWMKIEIKVEMKVANTLSWQIVNILRFGESVAKTYEFKQSHLYVFVWSAYTPLTVRFRGGPLCLRFFIIIKYIYCIYIQNHYLTNHSDQVMLLSSRCFISWRQFWGNKLMTFLMHIWIYLVKLFPLLFECLLTNKNVYTSG